MKFHLAFAQVRQMRTYCIYVHTHADICTFIIGKHWVLRFQCVKKAGLSLLTFRSGYSDLLQGEDEASWNMSFPVFLSDMHWQSMHG